MAESSKKWVFPLLIISTLTLFFVCLEIKYPYYFLQDDNRTQFLNFAIQSVRSLLSGDIAMVNYYQFLGMPFISSGQTQVLYPLIYVSAFLSDLIFGNYFALIDIEVIFHLIIGSLGFYYTCKFFDVDDLYAFFGAIVWSMCSFFIYFSNSWVIISGVAAYFPWMIYLSVRMLKGLNFKYMVLLIVCRLLHFYIGHAQFFIYSFIFEFLFYSAMLIILYKKNKDSKMLLKRVLIYIQSCILTFLFSLPLLIPMWNQINFSGPRSGKMAWDVFTSGGVIPADWLKGLLSPNVGYHVTTSFDNGFIGIIVLVFIVIALIKVVFAFFKKDVLIKKYIYILASFFFIAIFAFLWASNIISPLIYLIPFLNRFRWHFKLIPYVNFSLIFIAVIGLYSFISELKINIILKRFIIITIIMINFIHMSSIYLANPIKSIRVQPDIVPLHEPLQYIIGNERLLSVGFDWHDSYTAKSIGFDYATLWELYHLGGYDPIIPAINSEKALNLNLHAYYNELNGNISGIKDLDHLRTWGVKWYVVYNEYIKRNGDLPFEEKYKDDERTVYYDSEASPMVYLEKNGNDMAIDFTTSGNEIAFDTDSPDNDTVIVNFLYHSFYNAWIDGVKVNIQPTSEQQLSLNVEKGQHSVIIKYIDKYFIQGLMYIALFLILWIIKYIICSFRKGKTIIKKGEHI